MSDQLSRRQALSLGAAAGVSVLLSGGSTYAADARRRVIVWSEGTAPKDTYPNDIRGAIADGLKPLTDWEVVTATITDPDQGMSEDDLKKTEVLMWWGHKLHDKVTDETVDRIYKHVTERGMGFISLHSSHFAKPYKKLMASPCSWSHYVADGSSVKMIVMDPEHPICKGVGDFEIPHMERYGEPFKCAEKATTIFEGIYTLPNGKRERSRQCLTWEVGKGKVIYFQPGHETYPIFFQPEIQKIMQNAVQWAAPKASDAG
jgi:trehalose utilization protein